jgi:hypothetical protein
VLALGSCLRRPDSPFEASKSSLRRGKRRSGPFWTPWTSQAEAKEASGNHGENSEIGEKLGARERGNRGERERGTDQSRIESIERDLVLHPPPPASPSPASTLPFTDTGVLGVCSTAGERVRAPRWLPLRPASSSSSLPHLGWPPLLSVGDREVEVELRPCSSSPISLGRLGRG